MNSESTQKVKYTTAEIFFAQKMRELFRYDTIDSYRVRLHNPKTILAELIEVIEAFRELKIQHFDLTIGHIRNEATALLKEDDNLIFESITSGMLTKLLQRLSEKEHLEALVALKIFLSENINYANLLFDAIEIEIDTINDKSNSLKKATDLNKLNKLTGFLASELCSLGLSKQYLFHLTKSLFAKSSTYSFKRSFEAYRKSVIHRNTIPHKIYFKANIVGIDIEELKSRLYSIQDRDTIQVLKVKDKKFQKFWNEEAKQYPQLLCYQVEAVDDYTAIKSARKEISEIRDLLKFGYSGRSIKIFKNALIARGENFENYNEQSIHYQIDGRLDKSWSFYDSFLTKYNSIRSNPLIHRETKDRLLSAIRYFRLGEESIELEQRFLNYWIGIEYIFSSHIIHEGTFTRVKKFFSKLHTLTYLKRNIEVFNSDLVHYELQTKIPGYGEDLQYLKDPKSYLYIHDNFLHSNPLVAYRALFFSQILQDNKALKDYLNKHESNIEQHLTRIYRVRNELVHEAAIRPNIETLVANLRYYLFYIINSIIGFFESPPYELKLQDTITIDDYFLIKSLQYDNVITSTELKSALLNIDTSSIV